MSSSQSESLARAIAKLQRSIAEPELLLIPYRLAQLDLLEQLLDRAIVTTATSENSPCP